MGDSRRFDLFAGFVAQRLAPEMKIADVAGGVGWLNWALMERGFSDVTTFDKRKDRKTRKVKYKYGYFDSAVRHNFDAIIGMHPDDGTDHIIVSASRMRIPFIVCPCCIKPSAVAFWGQHKDKEWVKHLLNLAHNGGMAIETHWLKMSGRNLVIYGRPS